MGALPDLATRPRGGWPLPGVAARIGLGFLVGIVALIVAAIAFLAGMAVAYDGRVLPGVRVAGVQVAGLNHAQATALLEQRLPPLKNGTLTIRVGEVTDSVPLSAIGRGHDLPAMVDAALAIGHTGSPLERAADEVRALASGADISVAATFAPADLEALVTHVTAA
ncbi:MAG TPA: hypothetical protein VFW86_01165, partial [Candidatus Limnocylindrales bacterium]|nr:hypothetical protein [Candidatus Limnocylindrales bacterium]